MKCSLGESIEVIEPCLFEGRMKVTVEETRRLSMELTAIYRRRGRRKELFLSNEGLVTIRNAMTAALEIDDCEFDTRMGLTKEEVRDVLAEVSALVGR